MPRIACKTKTLRRGAANATAQFGRADIAQDPQPPLTWSHVWHKAPMDLKTLVRQDMTLPAGEPAAPQGTVASMELLATTMRAFELEEEIRRMR